MFVFNFNAYKSIFKHVVFEFLYIHDNKFKDNLATKIYKYYSK